MSICLIFMGAPCWVGLFYRTELRFCSRFYHLSLGGLSAVLSSRMGSSQTGRLWVMWVSLISKSVISKVKDSVAGGKMTIFNRYRWIEM